MVEAQGFVERHQGIIEIVAQTKGASILKELALLLDGPGMEVTYLCARWPLFQPQHGSILGSCD